MYPTIAVAVLAISIAPIESCYDEVSKTGAITACQFLYQQVGAYQSCAEELPDWWTDTSDNDGWDVYTRCLVKFLKPYGVTDHRSYVGVALKAVRDHGCDTLDKGFGLCLLKKCKSESDQCGVDVSAIEPFVHAVWLINSAKKLGQSCQWKVGNVEMWPGLMPIFC